LFTRHDRTFDGHHACAHDFAQHLVRQSYDCDIQYSRMRVQPVLHLARIHVEPAADDQLLAPTDDVHEAVLVDHAEVAGEEVAVLVEDLRRLARLTVIALHDAGASYRNLAEALAG